MSPDIRADLLAATAELLYPSETDAEFELVDLTPPFPWETSASEQVPVRQFFAEMSDGPDASAFHLLRQVLELRLTDVRADRVGSLSVDIYLTGVEPGAPKQNRVGVKTHAVET
jgi:hypothetical protein